MSLFHVQSVLFEIAMGWIGSPWYVHWDLDPNIYVTLFGNRIFVATKVENQHWLVDLWEEGILGTGTWGASPMTAEVESRATQRREALGTREHHNTLGNGKLRSSESFRGSQATPTLWFPTSRTVRSLPCGLNTLSALPVRSSYEGQRWWCGWSIL